MRIEKDHNLVREEARELMRTIQDKSTEYGPDRKLSLILEYIPGKVTDTIDRLIALYRPDSLVVGTRGRRFGVGLVQGLSVGLVQGLGGASIGSVSKYVYNTMAFIVFSFFLTSPYVDIVCRIRLCRSSWSVLDGNCEKPSKNGAQIPNEENTSNKAHSRAHWSGHHSAHLLERLRILSKVSIYRRRICMSNSTARSRAKRTPLRQHTTDKLIITRIFSPLISLHAAHVY
jgi:hypothetical protein